jgi:hypothetical protein
MMWTAHKRMSRVGSVCEVEQRGRGVELGQRSDRKDHHHRQQRQKLGAGVTVSKKNLHNSGRQTLRDCMDDSAANVMQAA